MKNHRDRYANQRMSDLLQRTEDSDGAVILATNFHADMDEAFQRRVNAAIRFPRPGQQAK